MRIDLTLQGVQVRLLFRQLHLIEGCLGLHYSLIHLIADIQHIVDIACKLAHFTMFDDLYPSALITAPGILDKSDDRIDGPGHLADHDGVDQSHGQQHDAQQNKTKSP